MHSSIIAAVFVAGATAAPWWPHDGWRSRHGRYNNRHDTDSDDSTTKVATTRTATFTTVAGGDDGYTTQVAPQPTFAETVTIPSNSSTSAIPAYTVPVVNAADGSVPSAGGAPQEYTSAVESAPGAYSSPVVSSPKTYLSSATGSPAQQTGESTGSTSSQDLWSSPKGESAPACQANPDFDIDMTLNYHNEKRAERGANSLVWDENLACIAQEHADTCDFTHHTDMYGGGYGQNLGQNAGIEGSMEMWWDEVRAWDMWGENAPAENVTGHFTAMVWASSTALGCATTSSGCSPPVTVCNYFCAGNMAGQYSANVLSG